MKSPSSFDSNVKRVEKIVSQLNQEDLPLEKGVKLFKEGMELIHKCRQQLQEAKDQVKIYLEEENNLEK
ncbi:MAG: exodeoxyribonuclease VII small subunit [Desulfonauticus sp.]|nr:exodeoxyribonuclease VII small subunit [Desulfonauticus sp.]